MNASLSGNLLVCLTSLCLTMLCLTTHCLASVQEDYCGLKCSDDSHTMCQYKKGTPGEKCTDFQNVGIQNGEKEDLLHIHNSLRMDVALGNMTTGNGTPQPPAADMMQLVWDEELATVAQRWADQCTYKHDKCRRVGRFNVGQNIGMRTAITKFTSEDMYRNIDMWASEVDLLDLKTIKKFVSSASDHYTQLVWASTGALGCGMSIYKSGDKEFTQLLVCNYGPAGNIPSTPVYTEGPACSACPEGTTNSTDYKGLCFSADYAQKVHDLDLAKTIDVSVHADDDDYNTVEPAASTSVAFTGLLPLEIALTLVMAARVS